MQGGDREDAGPRMAQTGPDGKTGPGCVWGNDCSFPDQPNILLQQCSESGCSNVFHHACSGKAQRAEEGQTHACGHPSCSTCRAAPVLAQPTALDTGTVSSAAGMRGAGTLVAQDALDVGAIRNAVKATKRKDSHTADQVHRLISQYGLRKVAGNNPCWKIGLKFANAPKPPPGAADHRRTAICSLCLKQNPSMAMVKLGANDSPTPFVDHLQYHHLETWQQLQPTKLVSIQQFATTTQSSNATTAQGGSKAPTPSGGLAKTTPHQHMGVSEWKSAQNALFGDVDKGKATVKSSLRPDLSTMWPRSTREESPDPQWTGKLAELVAEEFLPLNFP